MGDIHDVSHRRVPADVRGAVGRVRSVVMERPGKFEHFRFVGDKRTQVVYDVDGLTDSSIIEELMAAGTYTCFAPDNLAEARNRGYKLYGRRSRLG